MPVVTAIKRSARRGSLLMQVSLDGEYVFTLSDLDFSMSGLRVGNVLSPEEVEHYRDGAKVAKAYALALRFLTVRVRSRKELTDYLARKTCEVDDILEALDRLEGLGLVDDLAFARAWIADRQAVRPRSRLRLSQELIAKGVTRDIINQALEGIEPDTELTALAQLIERKQKLAQYQDDRKLTDYLARQGYSWELIKQAKQMVGDAT
jgi:regulatory protein